MCGGVKYTDVDGKEWKVYFPSPKAALPVAMPDGAVKWIKWGRRKEEQVPFVQGGWARSDSIQLGKWDKCNPISARLAVQSFMEKDVEKVSHWINIPEGKAIEALILSNREERRIYIVTEDTPPEFAWVHDRWPKLVAL